MAARPTNDRHKEFVRQYILNNRNATEAYRAVYPNNKNPHVDSAKLLANPSIQTLILIEENKCEEKFEVTRDMLIQQAVLVAFGSLDTVMDWDESKVTLKPKSSMTKSDIKFIDSISSTATEWGTTIKVTTLAKEKIKALEFIAKMMGFDKDDATRVKPYETILNEALADLKKPKSK